MPEIGRPIVTMPYWKTIYVYYFEKCEWASSFCKYHIIAPSIHPVIKYYTFAITTLLTIPSLICPRIPRVVDRLLDPVLPVVALQFPLPHIRQLILHPLRLDRGSCSDSALPLPSDVTSDPTGGASYARGNNDGSGVSRFSHWKGAGKTTEFVPESRTLTSVLKAQRRYIDEMLERKRELMRL
jgi:hypothetical protein